MRQPLRVLLFARYAELLGADAVDLAIELPATVGDVVDAVRARPGGEGLPPRVLCAVNMVQSGPDRAIRPGDEVALLPPLAGG